MDFQTMTIKDIIKWCQDNDEVAWLKKEAARQIEYEVYPRKKILNEKGKYISVADKDQKPKIEKRPISFIQIKYDFVDKFMPEIAPERKAKKPTMYDLIKAL